MRRKLIISIAMSFLLASAGPSVQAEDCFADWGTAAEIVKSNGLKTVEDLARSGGNLPGQIVKTTLCRENTGYVYRLVVRGADGRLIAVVRDAQPAAPSDGK